MLKVKSGLFLLKLEIHCMIGRKVKFTSNDQNTNRVFVFQRDKEKYLQKTNKMLMPVSEVCVSAVYDLPSMYFISFARSVGTTKYCQ